MSIVENAKEVAELVKKYNDLDLYQKIIDLRDEIFTLREQNLEIKERNKELEEALSLKGKIQKEGNVYYVINNDEKDGPFCITCWDDDKKLIHLYEERGRIISCGRCAKLIRGK